MPDSHAPRRQAAWSLFQPDSIRNPIPLAQPKTAGEQERLMEELNYRVPSQDGRVISEKIRKLGYLYSKPTSKGRVRSQEPAYFVFAIAARVPLEALLALIFEAEPKIDARHRRAIERELTVGVTPTFPDVD